MEQELSKTKNKDHSEVKFLRGKVRELEKQVRVLEKKLTGYQKVQHIYDDMHQSLVEVERALEEIQVPIEHVKIDPCDKCEHGEMVIKFEFTEMNKKIYQCTACGATRSK